MEPTFGDLKKGMFYYNNELFLKILPVRVNEPINSKGRETIFNAVSLETGSLHRFENEAQIIPSSLGCCF